MEKENLKITSYENGVSELPDYPSDEGYTAEMLKAVFDARSDKEIKEKHNALCDAAAEIFDTLKAHCEDNGNPHKVREEQIEGERRREIKVVSNQTALSEIIPEKDEVYFIRYEKLPYKDNDGNIRLSEKSVYVMKTGDGETSLALLPTMQNIVPSEGEGSLSQFVESEAPGYMTGGIFYLPASRAIGHAAVALGRYNTAIGVNSMAVNYNNKVKARDAFAANSGNSIAEDAEGAFVAGHANRATGQFQTVVGTYNAEADGALLVVGGGVSEETRKNILEVMREDSVEVNGNLNVRKTKEGNGKITSEEINVIGAGIFGYVSAAAVRTTDISGYGDTEINGTSRLGNAHISGETVHSEKCNAHGAGSAAFNRNNTVHGKYSFVALSSNTIPDGLESVFIAGHANTAAASHQAIFGTYAAPETSDAFVIGNGTSAGKKNAFAVGKSGNIRIGGTQITLGTTVITEAIVKKLWEIDSLKARIAELETRLSGESE